MRKLEAFSVKILKVGGEMLERWEIESVLLVQKKDLIIWFNLLLVRDNEILEIECQFLNPIFLGKDLPVIRLQPWENMVEKNVFCWKIFNR